MKFGSRELRQLLYMSLIRVQKSLQLESIICDSIYFEISSNFQKFPQMEMRIINRRTWVFPNDLQHLEHHWLELKLSYNNFGSDDSGIQGIWVKNNIFFDITSHIIGYANDAPFNHEYFLYWLILFMILKQQSKNMGSWSLSCNLVSPQKYECSLWFRVSSIN